VEIKVTIKTKLGWAFATILLAYLINAVLFFWAFEKMNWQQQRLTIAFSQLVAVEQLDGMLNRQIKEIADYFLTGEIEELDEFNHYKTEVKTAFEVWQKTIDGELAFVKEDELAEEREEGLTLIRLKDKYEVISDEISQMLLLKKAGKEQEALEIFKNSIEEKFDRIFAESFKKSRHDDREEVKESQEKVQELNDFIQLLSVIIIAISLILIVFIVLALSKTITGPLLKLKNAAIKIGQGEFSIPIETNAQDEIGVLGKNFSDMAGKLKERMEEREELIAELEKKNIEMKAFTNTVIKSREVAERAKEEAEHASRAKSDFLARMSHEFRTPMNAILGFGQLLKMNDEEPLTPTQKINVGHITEAGDHLLRLINELLDLSKIESGEMEILLEDVCVNRVLNELLALVKPLSDEMEINVVNKFPDDSEQFVWVDKTRFKQVLLNLISNAIKYNRKGGNITLEYEKTSAGRLCIRVKDTGIGIASGEDIESIFEIFSRVEFESTMAEGTGIGLNITKRLTELMGGTIAVESVLGEGSCFTVEFPIGKPHEGGEKEPPPQVSTAKDNSKYTVLYVEDNPANLELVRQILLSRPSIKLLSAPLAEAGIELAQAHQPDLILMDINLPGMGGIEAFRHLKSHNETSKIPVIAVSADAMQGDTKKALDEGFKDYITKPLNVPAFLNMMDKFLSDV
jgi:signal transduction histidine kinase/CheY-like chemotaxis protein